MKPKKTFDCVDMKWNIQHEIAREFSGISDEEAYTIQRERIARNPILGPFLSKVSSRQKQTAKKSEQV